MYVRVMCGLGYAGMRYDDGCDGRWVTGDGAGLYGCMRCEEVGWDGVDRCDGSGVCVYVSMVCTMGVG